MEEKLRVTQRLDSGVTAKNMASELGVGKSTVGDWEKIEQKLKSGVPHKLQEVE
jgi:DNA-binding transcriptional regulator YiaG